MIRFDHQQYFTIYTSIHLKRQPNAGRKGTEIGIDLNREAKGK